MLKYARTFLGSFAGDYLFAAINYNYLRLKVGKLPRWPNYRSPKTFNEKIAYLKMHYRHPAAHIFADKYAVREFVGARVDPNILIPLLGAFTHPKDICFDALPDYFVAKPNHASGLIRFCQKSDLDLDALLGEMKNWLATDYGRIGREYQYRDIERKILIEEDLRRATGDINDVPDYKFFCFSGLPKFVQVDVTRHTDHRRNFYDLEWNQLPFALLYPRTTIEIHRPATLRSMIDIARRLSEGLPFARIDLYESLGRVYFGEITLHPGGGMEPFSPDKYDRVVGDMLDMGTLKSSHLCRP